MVAFGIKTYVFASLSSKTLDILMKTNPYILPSNEEPDNVKSSKLSLLACFALVHFSTLPNGCVISNDVALL